VLVALKGARRRSPRWATGYRSHQRKDESYYLLSGRLLLLQGPDADHLVEREITPGSVWRNQPGDIHTIQALEDSDVLEVSTPDLDDVIRLKDHYGREGTSDP
jgi:mannose-6-phosphate isomerase